MGQLASGDVPSERCCSKTLFLRQSLSSGRGFPDRSVLIRLAAAAQEILLDLFNCQGFMKDFSVLALFS